MDQKYNAKYQSGKFKAKYDMYARKKFPSLKVSFREIVKGVVIEYDGWVENGEIFKGITKWYFDKGENFYWAGNCEEVEFLKPTDASSQLKIKEIETANLKHPLKLVHMKFYGPKSPEVITLREYISDVLGQGRAGNNLQCTEYVYYRILCAGHKIEWKRTSGHDGGSWPEAVNDKYKRLNTPVAGGVMSIPKSVIPPFGHITYVEKVNADLSINISEANWGQKNDLGHYWERTLPVSKWKNTYKAIFIDFNV